MPPKGTSSKPKTRLKGCEVEICQDGIEGTWRGVITAVFLDMDIAYYEFETEDNLVYLVPQIGVKWIRLIKDTKAPPKNKIQKQKSATLLTLCKS